MSEMDKKIFIKELISLLFLLLLLAACHMLWLKVDPFLGVKVLMISHFYVSFVCCKEDIATSIFRTFFYIWLQKHSKIVFVNQNHSNLLVACGFKRWNNDSGCHALLPSLVNLIFSSLHPLL